MIIATLPDGFRFTIAGDTALIGLPPIEATGSGPLEPVLSRKDAERIADVVVAREQKRRDAGVTTPLMRVRLTRDSRYARETLWRFSARLSVALVERGHDVAIEDRTTMSGTGLAVGVGAT